MSVGAIEPQFYAALLRGLGLEGEKLPGQNDRAHWPQLRERFAAIFATRTRAQWCAIFDGTDACVAPVLKLSEVGTHPHNKERGLLVAGTDGHPEPAPAPRLSRTPGRGSGKRPDVGEHTDAVLGEYGFAATEVADLRAASAIG